MATRYVRSTDGNNADDGSTWALAKADLTGVAAIDTAGDTIYVSDNHAESTAGAITLAFAGTVAAPTRLLCVDDTGNPVTPTALATGATVSTTGANNLGIQGNLYAYGIQWLAGSAANAANINLSASQNGVRQHFKSCDLILNNSNLGSQINTAASLLTFEDCRFRFGHANQQFVMSGSVRISGGSIISGGTSLTNFLTTSSGNRADVIVDGTDFSNFSSTVNLIGGSGTGSGRITFRNCKLPASWSGSLFNATPTQACLRAEMWNCDNASTNYRMWVEDAYGSIKQDTTYVKSGGATDGTQTISWKMVSSANASFPLPLASPEFAIWNDGTGATKTVTVDILHGSATALKNDEVWLEAVYLGNASFPISSKLTCAKTDILATPGDQPSSSATWAGGLASANTQKLTVDITPQMKGMIQLRVCLAKASYTVYVDPVAQLGDGSTIKVYPALGAGSVNCAAGGGLLTHPGMSGGMRG